MQFNYLIKNSKKVLCLKKYLKKLFTVCVVIVRSMCDWFDVVQALLHVLCWFLEYNLFVWLWYEALFRVLCGYFAVNDWRLEQFQDVIKCDGSFIGIMEMQFDDHFKFTPTGFGHFVRRFCKRSIRIRVTFMQFEMDLFHPGWHVFVIEWLHINRPLMCVTIFLALFAKRSSHIAVNDWLYDCYSLFKEQNTQYIIVNFSYRFPIKIYAHTYFYTATRIWTEIRYRNIRHFQ